jgi:cell division septation protein DedD
MEHFEGNQGKVREKSMYLLHLDTPRMIILGSVVVGLLVIAFLFGMNFIGNGGNSKVATGDILSGGGKDMALLDQNIPAPPHGGIEPESDLAALPEAEKDRQDLKQEIKKPEENLALKSDIKPSSDLLSGETIHEVIPPAKEDKLKGKEPKKSLASKKKEPVHTARKNREKSQSKKKDIASRKKSQVEAVVNDEQIRSYNGKRSGFAIQVASYDQRSRALSEVEKLKKMNYDAYIDSTSVNSRNFFRVRIGPMPSRERALSMLNELQDIERYSQCYMVRE